LPTFQAMRFALLLAINYLNFYISTALMTMGLRA